MTFLFALAVVALLFILFCFRFRCELFGHKYVKKELVYTLEGDTPNETITFLLVECSRCFYSSMKAYSNLDEHDDPAFQEFLDKAHITRTLPKKMGEAAGRKFTEITLKAIREWETKDTK